MVTAKHGDAAAAAAPDDCAICLSCLRRAAHVCLPCGHRFHAECVAKWLSRPSPPTCPVCRRLTPLPGWLRPPPPRRPPASAELASAARVPLPPADERPPPAADPLLTFQGYADWLAKALLAALALLLLLRLLGA